VSSGPIGNVVRKEKGRSLLQEGGGKGSNVTKKGDERCRKEDVVFEGSGYKGHN